MNTRRHFLSLLPAVAVLASVGALAAAPPRPQASPSVSEPPLPPDMPHADLWARLTDTAGDQIVVPATASYEPGADARTEDLVFAFTLPWHRTSWRKIEIGTGGGATGIALFFYTPQVPVWGMDGFWTLRLDGCGPGTVHFHG